MVIHIRVLNYMHQCNILVNNKKTAKQIQNYLGINVKYPCNVTIKSIYTIGENKRISLEKYLSVITETDIIAESIQVTINDNHIFCVNNDSIICCDNN